MTSLIAFMLGALWGVFVAKRRGGGAMDILLYAAVHGIILALLALFLTVFALRMEWI